MARLAPEPCATGTGNSPPARKLASLPLSATRFGSARLWNRPLLLHRPDHRAQVVLLAEEEQVQEVAEVELAFGARHVRAEVAARLRPRQVGEGRRRRTAGVVDAADRVVDAGRAGEERHAELGQRAAADLGEAHAQQHLVRSAAPAALQQRDDVLLLLDVAGGDGHRPCRRPPCVDTLPDSTTCLAVAVRR